jgi:DNA-binding XRE family transcriptional regulator
MSTTANNLAARLKWARESLGLSQPKMAASQGAKLSAYVTWEEGTRIPRPKMLEKLEAAITACQGLPIRKRKLPWVPFSEDRIPVCCGGQMQFSYKKYSRARKIWTWRFYCQTCGKTRLRDRNGRDVQPLGSGNHTPLPFPRPKCCDRDMRIKRTSRRVPELSNQLVYFLFCPEHRCPQKGKTRKFVEVQGKAHEVTRELPTQGGARRLNIEGRPLCRECSRPFMVQGQRKINGEHQVRFGCYRHGGSRWYHYKDEKWVPMLQYKHGPRPGPHSAPKTLPPGLALDTRTKCHERPMRLKEFPPDTLGGYRYRLTCTKCKKSIWLDANLQELSARKTGRPVGSKKKRGVGPYTRRADPLTRERNQVVFNAKLQGWGTPRLCRYLDSKHLPSPWKRDGVARNWEDVLLTDPRLPVRLFSVTVNKLKKRNDRERAFYFHGKSIA